MPIVLDRRRIDITDRAVHGSVQPYHAAKELGLAKAQSFLDSCADASRARAGDALRKAMDGLRDFKVTGCGILTGSGRPMTTLEATLASHAAIHTAEGEFFRNAIRHAADHWQLPCRGVREKELFKVAAVDFGVSAEEVTRLLAKIGKELGPPWSQDEKYAALAGWLALAAEGT